MGVFPQTAGGLRPPGQCLRTLGVGEGADARSGGAAGWGARAEAGGAGGRRGRPRDSGGQAPTLPRARTAERLLRARSARRDLILLAAVGGRGRDLLPPPPPRPQSPSDFRAHPALAPSWSGLL